jgi:hypothetical protein
MRILNTLLVGEIIDGSTPAIVWEDVTNQLDLDIEVVEAEAGESGTGGDEKLQQFIYPPARALCASVLCACVPCVYLIVEVQRSSQYTLELTFAEAFPVV